MIEARLCRKFLPKSDSAGFTLDLEFEAGPGITVLFGPSGSGKTLTLDCIAGFERPDSGRILLDDAIVFDSGARVNLRPQLRRCGYVFQNYALFPHLTLRENLLFATAGSRRIDQTRRVTDLMAQFRLTEVAGRKPHELSGGQKQRCSIARALAGNPRVLLLDEPARGLDAPLRAELYSILHELRETAGTPMLLVTHNLDECFELGDNMLVVHEGKIVQQGQPANVCSRPDSADLARLLGTFNILPVEIRALDPSRNSSILRWGEVDLLSEYHPGYLNGDRVQLLVNVRQLTAMPRLGTPGPNQIPLELIRAVDMAGSVRLEFEGGICVESPGGPVDRNNGDWLIQFPSRGLRVI